MARLHFKRRDYRGAHRYTVTTDDGTVVARDLYGVTTTLNVLDKPALIPWAARLAGRAIGAAIIDLIGKYAIDDAFALCDELRKLATVDGYQFSQQKKEKAGERGTDGHALCEELSKRYAAGEAIDDDAVIGLLLTAERLASDDCYLIALAYRDWLLRVRPRVVSTERMVACIHCQYAATEDLECEIDGDFWVIDLKTSAGIYDSYALQVVAQDHARLNTDQYDPKTHHGSRYPENARTGCLWLSKDAENGCELVETVNSRDVLEVFFGVLRAWRWRQARAWRVPKEKPAAEAAA